jgi:hypothetical protein
VICVPQAQRRWCVSEEESQAALTSESSPIEELILST